MVALVDQNHSVISDDVLDAVLSAERLNDSDIEFAVQGILGCPELPDMGQFFFSSPLFRLFGQGIAER